MMVAVLAGLYGAIVASFLCVVAERVPRGRSIGGRSECVCGRQLTWWENLPVVGWLAAGGRARCCGARLPLRYLAAESGLAAVWAAAAWTLPPMPAGAAMAGSACAWLLLLIHLTRWDDRTAAGRRTPSGGRP